ncbi:MAG: outer membrane beta-barrel protein [Alistipes sp.]|nr:outer membrane beta-barrel protein [Alistipes sp.]
MKKLLLLLVAVGICSQVSAGLVPRFRFGVKAGMDYQTTNFKFSDVVSSDYKFDLKSNTGWYAGVQGDMTWGIFGIHPELIYSHNSFDLSGMGDKIKCDRLHMPILAQIRVLGILAIQAGPNFLLMTNTGGKMEGVNWSIKNPTMSYSVGAEVKVWKLAISARYNGAFKQSQVVGIETGKDKVEDIQIGLGYYF